MSPEQIEQIRAKAKDGQPNAQFLFSQICFRNSDFEGMIHWLKQASENDHPEALEALGHCHERGLNIAQDFAAAIAYYDQAIGSGVAQAGYRKANLLYRSKRGQSNEASIRDLLFAAANAGSVAALGAIGYIAMQRESSMPLAFRCLRPAAEAGDPASCFNLGWCLSLDSVSSDRSGEAAFWLQRAAARNYPYAEIVLASLKDVRPATKLTRSSDREEIGAGEIDASFSLFPESMDVEQQKLNRSPPITVFNAVLNIPDCAYLIYTSRQHLQRAEVIDPTSDMGELVSDVRTNLSTFLPFELVDIISRYVELKSYVKRVKT